MIKLTGINKIYRTNEIETVALENVNLEVDKGEFLSIDGTFRLRKIYVAEHYGFIGCTHQRYHRNSWYESGRHEGQGAGCFP